MQKYSLTGSLFDLLTGMTMVRFTTMYAFALAGWSPIGGQSRRGAAPQVFSYRTTGDNLATVKGSGYFDSVNKQLEADDIVMVRASDGLAIIGIAAISAAGVVTTETEDISAA